MSEQRDLSLTPVSEESVIDACPDTPLPRMGVIAQRWDTDPIPADDVATEAANALAALPLETVPQGGEVAVGAGSRGIDNVAEIVSGVVTGLQQRGFSPFVFPAMGSHGGATAAGQREKLAALGIDEEAVGCEIRATMDVVEVGRTPDLDVPVVADANAAAADAIIPVNRVKAHTDFDGPVESGLAKMLVIGMGKQAGARTTHERSVDWSLREMIPTMAERIMTALPVVGGIAIVEDQADRTAAIEGVPPSDLLEREAELLKRADDLMPTLPFDDLDVLVVDRMGKDISGAGMDPNVTGRRPFALDEPAPETPEIKRIFVRSLTDPSHGNVSGIGCAEFAHRNVVADLDLSTTLVNSLTASTPRGIRIPPVVETDRAGLVAALSTVGVVDPETVRVARITDTSHLQTLFVSEALVTEARSRSDLEVVREPAPIEFDDGDVTAPTPATYAE